MAEAAGLEPASASRATTFPHFYLALEAALAGAGALVCPLETVSDLLSKVELKEPLPQIRIPGSTYTAIYDPDSQQADAAAKFVKWLSWVQKGIPAGTGSALMTAGSVGQRRASF
jgi:LysR family glycine cleavage system transcriptional activator